MGLFSNWRRARILKRHMIPQPEWQAAIRHLPLLRGLTADEHQLLRELATLLLHEKHLEPVQGLELNDRMKFTLAAQAVLPILHLGIGWYDGWTSLVLYPDQFASRVEWVDEYGVAHSRREVRSGEAWGRGPVVLSWADVAASGQCDGYNTVIHEMAHKLDGSSGHAEGCPALHRGMSRQDWHAAFTTAYEDMCRRVDGGEETAIDPYASEAPAEFFAVASEHFFETPAVLAEAYPAVYRQLTLFYRQQPLARLAGNFA